ncbi:MAG: hypothetical protein IKQ70_02230 [Bacteroidales bacterium]|nr:hypothetical protein [Bacteroidales bacterium]
MKTRITFILLLALAASCSQSGTNSEESSMAEIITTSNTTTSTMNIESVEESDSAISAPSTPEPSIPEAYSKYNLNLIDDDSIVSNNVDTTGIVTIDTSDSNKYRLAFKTGMSFGAVHKSRPTNEQFSDIILKNEQKGDASSAAIMMAGKYFKMLQICADKNADEKRLKQAVDGLENLRNYINDALQSNKDVNTNLILQKISENTLACRSVYEKCNEDYNGESDKYRILADTIRIMQKNLFAD